MITDYKGYKEYRRCDLAAYQLDHVSLYNYLWMDYLHFQLRLRKIEYLYNTKGRNPFKNIAWVLLEFMNHRLATRLGLTIPKNVFGPGLCIVHYGTIVVSPLARVRKNCRIHPSTSIGDYNGAPTLGDNVYIGPGAKIYGNIQIGDNTAIGANSVVCHSFDGGCTIAGAPAHVVSDKSSTEQNLYSKSILF